MSSSVDSDVNLKLPQMPLVTDLVLHRELLKIYDAFRIVQIELSQTKARIKILEQYNITNP